MRGTYVYKAAAVTMSRGSTLLLAGLAVLQVLQAVDCGKHSKKLLTRGQHLKDLVRDLRQKKQQSRTLLHNAQPAHTDFTAGGFAGRSLKQESANVFGACPAEDYIYAGSTPDSIFNQLTVAEFQSAAQALANEYGYVLPYGSYDTPITALTPVGAPEASIAGLNSTLTVGQNLTDLGPNSATTPGLYDPDNPVLNENITQYEDYVFNVWHYPVNKQQALDYLDKNGPLPPRYAKAIVVRGSVPDVMEYKIGPLPMGPNSSIVALHADGTIPYTKRPPNDLPESLNLGAWTEYVQGELKELFLHWLGQCGDASDPQCANNNITAMNIEVPTRELTRYQRLSAIVHFYQVGNGSSYELHNLPFAYKINTTELDDNDWELFEFEFCGQGFETMDELVTAFKDKKLNFCYPVNWTKPTYNDTWAEDDILQYPLIQDVAKPGPRLYEPAGKRFVLLQGDNENSRVFQWGGWQAHVSSNPWTGLTFHDVKFKGERIAYEISLNDQIVAYSGWETVGQTFYLDSFDQLGASQYTLLPGYDCPETAAYMPVTAMAPFGETFTANESVCMFESYGQTTTWRHFDGTMVNSVRDYSFTVRTAMTLGNYDYVVTVSFNLDASIKIQVYMAGYLQALYYDTVLPYSQEKENGHYGTRVETNTIGNVHDHLSSWKVDLDVLGTQNSFHNMAIRVGTYDEVLGPGNTPIWALPTDEMKYQDDQRVSTETGYVLDYRVPQVFRFVNEQQNNSWGVPRGYGIFHGYTNMQLLPTWHPICQAAAWSKWHIAVAQRKENETTSSQDYYDSHSPIDPMYTLNNAINGESIVGQDLVAWVSMGIIHVPRSEDVPLISNLGTEFYIKPVNYFDALADLDILDSDNFTACAADQGLYSNFDYSYGGENTQGNKAGFKFSGPIDSRDQFADSPPAKAPAFKAASQPTAEHMGKAPASAQVPFEGNPAVPSPQLHAAG